MMYKGDDLECWGHEDGVDSNVHSKAKLFGFHWMV